MAVEQVSSRLVQPVAATAATEGASLLREGTVLEGRVLAVNPDDSLRLATRVGQMDIDPSLVHAAGGRTKPTVTQDLVGTTVKFELSGQTSAGGRLLVRLIDGQEDGLATAAAAATESDTTPEQVSARIALEVSQAAARQDGLAAVFAAAQQLGARGDLPDPVTDALANLAAFALAGDDAVSGDSIRTAFLNSGLFLEARLAQGLGGSTTAGFDPDVPLAHQDLKAALLSLKAALDGWVASDAAEAAGTMPDVPETTNTANGGRATGTGDPSAPASAQGAAQSTAQAAAQTLAAASTGGVDTEALFAVLRPPPTAGAPGDAAALARASVLTQSPPGAAANLALSDMNTLATLGSLLESAGFGAPGIGRRGPYGGRTIVTSAATRRTSDDGLIVTGRPPPPRRGSLPLGQAAIETDRRAADALTRRPADLARELSARISNAVARISLGQYASLPETQASASRPAAAAASHEAQAAAWLFEIPVRLGPGVNIAQFEIDPLPQGSAADGRAWRVQFSLDAPDLGPVHGRLVLGGHRLSIGLWAEAQAGMTAIGAVLPELRRGLEAAGFGIDEIHFSGGRPPSGPPVKAGGFIDRNA